MQDWSNFNDALQRVDIVLFDQFSNHCVANFVEPLRAANGILRKDAYHWRFLTLDGAPVHSSSGLQIAPHAALADAHGTAIFLMPSYGFRALDRPAVIRSVRQAATRASIVGGCDTGSWLLARAGLLSGCRATIHWDVLDTFAETFPEVDATQDRFVIDGARVTCSGAMAAFDLVTHLIDLAHGAPVALDVRQLFMSRDLGERHRSGVVGRTVQNAVALMQDHIETPLPIAEIARQVGCTQKTLEQRVRKALGQTPAAVYRRQRLNAARRLVRHTDLPVSEIAGRCGYDNASAMTRAYRAAFGDSPQAMRAALR